MATYKVILRNPYRKSVKFVVSFNGGFIDVPLKPFETKDLSLIHPSFTITANSTTDINAQARLAEIFMSNNSNPAILLKGQLTKNSKTLTIHEKPYSEFLILSA